MTQFGLNTTRLVIDKKKVNYMFPVGGCSKTFLKGDLYAKKNNNNITHLASQTYPCLARLGVSLNFYL